MLQLLSKDGPFELPIYTYQYEIPIEEEIHQLQISGNEEGNPFFLYSFLWGLQHGDEKTKAHILLGFTLLEHEETEYILRQFLLKEKEPLSLKKKALIALEEINVDPPYRLKINGKDIEMDRQTPDFSVWKNNWLEVLEHIEKSFNGRYSVIEMYDAKILWYEFISQTYPKTPQIRKIEGWVAAIEFLVAKMHRKPVPITKLANKYEVAKQTISKHIHSFEEILQVDKKVKNTFLLEHDKKI